MNFLFFDKNINTKNDLIEKIYKIKKKKSKYKTFLSKRECVSMNIVTY